MVCVLCALVCFSYQWLRGSAVLQPSSGGRVSVSEGSLTISHTWSGDIGDYSCTVSSAAGNTSHSARLEVMYVLSPPLPSSPPLLSPPLLSSSLLLSHMMSSLLLSSPFLSPARKSVV